MKPIEVYIPVSSIPAIKKAARELNVEFTDGEEDGEFKSLYFLICDYGTLMSIGYLAGVNVSFEPIQSAMKQMEDSANELFDKLNKNTNNDTGKLG